MITPAPRRPSVGREGGFTLIELLIYSMLSILLLVIVGGILINSIKAEQTVRTASEGTSTGQLAAQSISTGVRNSSSLSLTAPDPGTQLLRTRSVGSGTTAVWRCQAWYFGAGEIRTKTSTTAIPVPSAADALGWTLLADGISLDGSTPVFAASGAQVELNYYVSTGDGLPLLIDTTAVSRQPLGTGLESPTCF